MAGKLSSRCRCGTESVRHHLTISAVSADATASRSCAVGRLAIDVDGSAWMPSVITELMYEYSGRFLPRLRSSALMYGHFAFHASSSDISARLLPDLEDSSGSAPSR